METVSDNSVRYQALWSVTTGHKIDNKQKWSKSETKQKRLESESKKETFSESIPSLPLREYYVVLSEYSDVVMSEWILCGITIKWGNTMYHWVNTLW